MTFQDLIAVGVVGLAMLYLGRAFWQNMIRHERLSSCCRCAKVTQVGADGRLATRSGLRQTPLVALGLPDSQPNHPGQDA